MDLLCSCYFDELHGVVWQSRAPLLLALVSWAPARGSQVAQAAVTLYSGVLLCSVHDMLHLVQSTV